MSAAGLAAAKKRRAGNTVEPTNNTLPQTLSNRQNTTSGGLPLQTIISTFNTRISKLENNTNSTSQNYSNLSSNEEYETRFNLLVDEISELKEMVLKLQSFTMEVNKSLFDERIKVLSAESVINNAVENVDDIEDIDQDELHEDINKIKENVENINLDS